MARGERSNAPHGTYNRYHNLGCRCDECRQENTDYYRERAHHTGRHRPQAVVSAERRAAAEARHGTASCYRFGCRCDACKAAAAAAKARQRARNAEHYREYDRNRKAKGRAA